MNRTHTQQSRLSPRGNIITERGPIHSSPSMFPGTLETHIVISSPHPKSVRNLLPQDDNTHSVLTLKRYQQPSENNDLNCVTVSQSTPSSRFLPVDLDHNILVLFCKPCSNNEMFKHEGDVTTAKKKKKKKKTPKRQ